MYITVCIYIYRAEAGGSPEANCNLIVWIWKMLILYCVLQCFLPSLESVPSVKVSMSARINLEFVRAEKWYIYIFHGWPKMCSTLFPLELRFHTFFQFLLISTKCHNPLENHGRNEHHIFFIFAFPNLFFGMAMENVVFTLCFTVLYVFLWNGLINRTSIFIAEELDVCPCWNRKILHLPWMTKDVWNMLTIWSAVSFMLVVLFRSRTCDNAPSNIFQHSTSSNALHMTLLHPPPTPTPPTPPSVNNNETCNVATSSNQATSSRIQHHPTHFTWRYYTPPTPPLPPSVNNNETCNVATSSNQATSSRIQHHPTHFTWRYYTPPHPPPPHPICIQERRFWYSIKTEGSSKLRGTPSLEPIYI